MTFLSKEAGRKRIKDLVNQFKINYLEYKNGNYNETQLRIDFINPLLEALGWDVFNSKGVSQHLREVIQEDTVNVEDDGIIAKKKPDYALCLYGKRKLYIEVKKPAVHVENSIEPAFQVRRYGWNAQLPVSILTNFDKFIVYDCRYRPTIGEDARIARISVYNFEDILEKFDEIHEKFSAESVYSGKFDEIFSTDEDRAGREAFDRYFLEQIEHWRLMLAENLLTNNFNLKQEEINFLVQRLINRIVFLRICEDRELEKYRGLKEIRSYSELKHMFKRADERYNSGLFDFLEDELSLNVILSDELIIELFKELYFPESPYAFSVVESSVLGEIYEQFLAKEIRINDNNKIAIVDKPEIIESNGVVTTPRYIVDSIIEKTIYPLCQGKTPLELSNLRIADIACGSGVFLLAAYEYLLTFHLEWYLENDPSQHTKELQKFGKDQWKLTLYEKQRILRNNIYGVDIDAQAVEVARFSLLLKILENETAASVDAHLSQHRVRVLPNLDDNIQCGNSLVDYSYFEFPREGLDTHNQLININPFDWKSSFREIFLQGGFDVIIGNPPYIRIQNMVKYSPIEFDYYRSEFSPYSCATSDNFDKYILFIERSLTLLKKGGYLGVIVPHKFFSIKSGRELRELISKGQYLNEIVHFGVEQVFKGKLTYTCIIKLIKSQNERFTIEHVTSLKSWVYDGSHNVDSYPASEISAEPWIFLHPKVKDIFNEIRTLTSMTVQDVADIFVGIQTSADDKYIIHPVDENDDLVYFEDKNKVLQIIERGILRPFFHDVKFTAFGKPSFNAYVIFPYKEFSGRSAVLYSPEEMQRMFPKCWSYLYSNKESLLKRSVNPPFTEDTWFKYGRSQSLTKFNGAPKLVWTVLSLEPRYVYDDQDIVFSGGGNGPYYGLRVKVGNPHSIHYVQAILCNPVIEAMLKTGKTSKFQGGYYSHGKQFVDVLPFRAINFNDPNEVDIHEKIIDLVQQLMSMMQAKDSTIIPHERKVIERNCNRLKAEIDSLVNFLYGITQEKMTIIEELT
ncbi:Eco57I restriction-modification methylase domain-containing protein [Brevibacillus borstelensis]|uniref:Eco57I restriction-modification methylase domain-containing protein n=1 Tax=Brevibacillus borstelensis TaxID=45462 RepID=UPI001D09E59F|nr:Eco57I restriction-modification methylase domain-containing protein [Brevibacillus borstelensis]MCC0563796.1 Eco57I restriction-modification methylase domain-containing protein [Brevibacillus borstelensis]